MTETFPQLRACPIDDQRIVASLPPARPVGLSTYSRRIATSHDGPVAEPLQRRHDRPAARPAARTRGVGLPRMDTQTPSHTLLADCLGADGARLPRDDAKALRRVLGQNGVTARGARLYLDYGDSLFAPLGSAWIRHDEPAHALSIAIAWLRLLQACEMDIAPPPAFVRAMLTCCRTPADLVTVPPALLRAAWRG